MTTNKQNHIGHTAIEFGYNLACGSWGMMSESRGRISELERYIAAIDRVTYDKFTENKDAASFDYTLTEDDFNSIENKFFDRIAINVSMSVGSGRIESAGYFNSDKSGVSDDGSKFVTIVIKISQPTYLTAIQELNKIVGHELIHARHELSLLQKFGHTISSHNGDGNYASFSAMANLVGKYRTDNGTLARIFKTVGYILYMTCPSETNAFTGECYDELYTMKDEISDGQSAYQCITKTETWQKIQKMKRLVSKLSKVDDIGSMYEAVVAYCDVMGITDERYTWSDMLGSLEARVSRFEEHFMSRASKMACDVFFQGKNYNPRARNGLFMDSLSEDIGEISKYLLK